LWIGEWLCSADIISETDYVAVIRFQPGAKRLNDLRVRLQLHNSQGQPVLKQELSELRGEHLDVTLALDSVPLGNYTLHALLTDRAGAPVAEATAPLRKRVKRKQLREPDRQQVSLRVWNDDHGVPRLPWLLYVRSAEPKYL
jgi:hypothetical protein